MTPSDPPNHPALLIGQLVLDRDGYHAIVVGSRRPNNKIPPGSVKL